MSAPEPVLGVPATTSVTYAVSVASMALEFVRKNHPEDFRAWLRELPQWKAVDGPVPDDDSLDYADEVITTIAASMVDIVERQP